MASVKEESLCSKVQVFEWNEIVYGADKGDDLIVSVIKNQFFIKNIPLKIVNPADWSVARDYLCHYRFFYPSHWTDDMTNKIGVLRSDMNWKELVKFDRRCLSDKDFGYKILGTLDRGLFLDETLVHLGKQISAHFNCRFPSDFQTKSRIVIKVEIYRARTIQLELKDYDILHSLMSRENSRQIFNTIRYFVPRSPYEKILQASFDPYFKLENKPVYDHQVHKLVTECDIYDDYLPEEDDDDIFEIIGFMRARILTLYPIKDGEEILRYLRARMKEEPSAAYPYKLMSPEETTGMVEVEPLLPRPRVTYGETICPICLDNTRYYSNPFAETRCFHSFHAACLSQWISKTPSCPLCRFRLLS